MKILIHSNAPWVPTGYGVQTALALRQLTALGHDVAVSAFWGLRGGIVEWNGHTIYPGGKAEYGQDVMIPHADHFGADLIITLMDFWKFKPMAGMLRQYLEQTRGRIKLAAWLPIDCTPLADADRETLLTSGATPIAMSRFGFKQLKTAGFDPVYIPHSVDTAVFQPLDRAEVRKELALGDQFVVGINAANKDAIRKAFPEQFQAFHDFAQIRTNAILLVNSDPYSAGGHRLDVLAQDLGISERVVFTDEYPQIAGLLDQADMANWYNACDVVSNCSYGEGFGLAVLEAQACGVPVVTTHASAMTELNTNGLVASSTRFWNPYHRAWWVRPDTMSITDCYQAIAEDWGAGYGDNLSGVEFAEGYSVQAVRDDYWKPWLETLS